MRRTPQPRNHSRDGAAPPPQVSIPVKKVFNCIVDETALLAGAKKSTRDGIRKWITNGQIRLFVPLHTLNQATRLKDKGSGRVSSDAEEALFWLDDATSNAPHLVTLQGGYEKFESWTEVEKFALPKPLFSEEDFDDYEHAVDNIAHKLDESQLSSSADKVDKHLSTSSADSEATRSGTPDSLHSLHSAVSPLSPPESPDKSIARTSTKSPQILSLGDISLDVHSEAPSPHNPSDSGVPPQLRSLFNYILWRVQQEIDPAAALESFIFLCDDPAKGKLAQRFGIKVKSLADIRYVVAREEREYRNRQVVQRKENQKANPTNGNGNGNGGGGGSGGGSKPSVKSDSASTSAPAPEAVDERESSDEDEIVFKRPPKAPAAMIAAQEKQSPRLSTKVLDPNQFSRSSGGRGNGRGGTPRGAAAHKGSVRGHATMPVRDSPARGGVLNLASSGSTGPIDPDSFSRPSANGGRGRGGSRRLFVPT